MERLNYSIKSQQCDDIVKGALCVFTKLVLYLFLVSMLQEPLFLTFNVCLTFKVVMLCCLNPSGL